MPYDTQLSPAEEQAFQGWKAQYAPNDSGVDYDLRGAYKAGLQPDASGPNKGHWPDTFKKPNHPTFSNESQYAKFGNPGSWNGQTFIPGRKGPMTPEEEAVMRAILDRDEKARVQKALSDHQGRRDQVQQMRTQVLDKLMPMPADAPAMPPQMQGPPQAGMPPVPQPRLQDLINPVKIPSPTPAQPTVPIIGTRG